MQSSSDEKQYDDDSSTQAGGEEPTGKSDPLPVQDSFGLQSDNLDPQTDPDFSVAGPSTSDVMTNPNLPEEKELPVLDPDHPMVKRYQDAVTIHLTKTLEKLQQGIKEKRAIQMAKEIEIEQIASETRHVHKQLAKIKLKTEAATQAAVQAKAKRLKAQDKLKATKSKFSDLSKQCSEEEASGIKLQEELDKKLKHLSFTQQVSEDLRSRVKTMKNVQDRAGAEKTQAEDQKFKKDLYVTHLTKNLEKLTLQVDMYEAQRIAQAEVTKATKEALSEAEIEMESLLLTRKQLLQEWNSTHTSIMKRNEAFCAMQEAVCSVENQARLLEREIEAYKKASIAEQEKNETLTAQLNFCEAERASLKQQISQKHDLQEALQAEYSTCLRAVQQTEQTISTLTKESNTYQTELNNQRKEMEKEKSLCLELEDKITLSIQQQLSHNKAARNSQQVISKMAALKKDKTCQLQKLERDILSVELETQERKDHLSSMALDQKALDEEIDKYNTLLSLNQTKYSKFVHLIDQKQTTIVNLKTKISNITAITGHDDQGPLHIKVEEMMHQNKELDANIKKSQELLMVQQGTLVGLSKDLETKNRMLRKLQTQYMALKQKEIHLESQIEQEEKENTELKKSSKILDRDLEKLNNLLSKNQHLSHALEQENTLMEKDFIQQVKENEWRSVGIRMKVEAMQEEKEILCKSVEEAVKQIALWKKKTQTLKETRAVVDSKSNKEEIRKMKSEIRRMELRISQLTKQQNKLMRESEEAVARRARIIERKEFLDRSSHKEKAMAEMKRSNEARVRKIKRTKLEVAKRENVNLELKKKKDSLSNQIEQQTQRLTELSDTSKHLDSELENLRDTKHTKQTYLFALQNRNKKLRDVCEGKYRVSSTGETVGAAQQRQRERLEAVDSVLHSVCEELPQHQEALRKVSQTVTAYKQISLEKWGGKVEK